MKIIGIDLGTTFSLIAEFNPDTGNVTVIPDESGGFGVPSAVYYPESGLPMVGQEAITAGEFASDRVVRFIKTTMGSDYRKSIGGRDYSPAEISAEILRRLLRNAASFLNVGPTDFASIVVAVPAYFGDAACAATLEAARLAGFDMARVRLFPEPCAAALAYMGEGTELRANSCRVLVSDLGGWTYDATVINANPCLDTDGRERLKLDVICKVGSQILGGALWDDALEEYVKKHCASTEGHSTPDWTDPNIRHVLRERVIRGKEILSHLPSVTIACCPGRFLQVSRAVFEVQAAALLSG
jgi:molecular chaperone DnaK